MIRKLAHRHLQNNGTIDRITDWRMWIMQETIRRTLFLGNVINNLSYRMGKQNSYYFEPLDDNLILKMPLPAPSRLWKASSKEEWLAVKENLTAQESAWEAMTLEEVLKQYTADPESNSLSLGREDISAAQGPAEFRLEALDEFTRLILATAKAN